jgi:mannose-1-phosphate guanylyltransferase
MMEQALATQHHAALADRLWGIVPAGTRLRRRWRFLLPGRRPFNPAPLSSALERAGALFSADRLVAVLARGHEHDASALDGVRLVVQPAYRGSAAEVFLPLLAIVRRDPQAIVAVLPADAAGQDEPRFLATVETAAAAVASRPDLPLIIGLAPPCTRPAGWVQQGNLVTGLERFGVRAVRRFIRRPSFAEAAAIHAGGGLASTGVIVAQAETLLDLGRRNLPDVLETLEPLEHALGGPEERLLCEAVYEAMPYANLSHALFAAGEPVGILAIPRTSTRVRPVASA